MNPKHSLPLATLLAILSSGGLVGCDQTAQNSPMESVAGSETPTTIRYQGQQYEATALGNGQYLIQGDMIVQPDAPDAAGRLYSTQAMAWPNGVVKYSLASTFTASDRAYIANAMATWTNRTNGAITFVESPAGKDVLAITRDTQGDNRATVGYWESGNSMILNPFHMTFDRAVLHEIGHVLGLKHEHIRSDIAPLVSTTETNGTCRPSRFSDAISAWRNGEAPTMIGAAGSADLLSIMLYQGSGSFAPDANRTDCIGKTYSFKIYTKGTTQVVGTKAILSAGDSSAIQELYRLTFQNIPRWDKDAVIKLSWGTSIPSASLSKMQASTRGAAMKWVSVLDARKASLVFVGSTQTAVPSTGSVQIQIENNPATPNRWSTSCNGAPTGIRTSCVLTLLNDPASGRDISNQAYLDKVLLGGLGDVLGIAPVVHSTVGFNFPAGTDAFPFPSPWDVQALNAKYGGDPDAFAPLVRITFGAPVDVSGQYIRVTNFVWPTRGGEWPSSSLVNNFSANLGETGRTISIIARVPRSTFWVSGAGAGLVAINQLSAYGTTGMATMSGQQHVTFWTSTNATLPFASGSTASDGGLAGTMNKRAWTGQYGTPAGLFQVKASTKLGSKTYLDHPLYLSWDFSVGDYYISNSSGYGIAGPMGYGLKTII